MKWKQHLTTKIASYFLLLSLVSVGTVGGVAFLKARDDLKKAAFDRLNVAATLKEEEITRWFEDQQRDFLLTTQFPDVQAKLNKILSDDLTVSDYHKTSSILLNYFQKVKGVKPNLEEISILDRTNKIIISTNKTLINQYELLANITYVEKFQSSNNFAPIFYVSQRTDKPAVTLAKTLRNKAGVRQGIILANLKLERVDDIVRERTGLGKTGETYLVGSLGISRNTFIAKEEADQQQYNQGIQSEGIDKAMSGLRGYGLYHNYDNVPVLGVYRWLNDQDLALIVEIRQQEAFAPARDLANTIMLIGLVSVGVLLIGVYWLSQQLIISQRKLEDYSYQLELKAQEAETANHAKSQFLANMSHELRTPLNAILGFAKFMERDRLLTLQQRDYLAIINRSGEHLLCLINDVLEMSKIEAGRTTLNLDNCNLNLLLQSLQEMFKLRAVAKGLSLEFELDNNLPNYIVTDEGKLRQILINLLGNAIKFTEQGSVKLRANVKRWDNNLSSENICTVYFEVEDTGKGINPEEIDKIFDPFVQTASGVQTQGGTGLGLAISRQFVQLMGGDIYPSSTPRKGSTFGFDIKVTLPTTSPVTYFTSTRVVQVAPNQPNYRILVVDDRLENRELLAKLLNTVGFDTRTATNGVEAIDQWQAWQPDLIWMDMRMSQMDGYEATKRIKAYSQHKTVVIALTASAFNEEKTAIFAAGCDDLVHKPFQEEIIFDKINKYLGVEYIYEEPNEIQNLISNPSPTDNFTNSILQDLNLMPVEWITKLHQAALEVDADLILQLIQEIPQSHPTLAAEIRQLTSQYDFDTIINTCYLLL